MEVLRRFWATVTGSSGRVRLSVGAFLLLASMAGPDLLRAQFPVEIGATTLNRNRAILTIANGRGQAGSIASGSSVGNGGFWVTTQNPYIFAAGPTIGARIPSLSGGGLDTVAFIGGPFSQVEPGSAVFDKLRNQGGAGVLWDTTNPTDTNANGTPDVIEQFPEACTVDNTRVQQFPGLSSFRGLPFPGFADQTVCLAVNDVLGPTCDDCANTRLGAEVVETWFTFSVPQVQDFAFFIWRIYNRSDFINATNAPRQIAGPYDLQDVSVAIAADPDIGNSADDQITFFPEINTMVAWDFNFNEETFVGTPGFVGFNYLRTPLDPVTGEEVGLANFTVFSRSGGRPDPENPQEWYEGLTGDPNFVLLEIEETDIRGMASSNLFNLPAGESVEIYGAIFFAPVKGAPPEMLFADAPFLFQNGMFVVDPAANFNQGRLPGNPFELIVLTQQTAQQVFDAGFIVPTAPPKPDFALLPGDHKVTVTWKSNSLGAVNPFAKIAHDPFTRLSSGQRDPEAEGQGIFLGPDDIIFDPDLDQGGTSGFLTAAEAGLVGVEVTNPAWNGAFLIQDFQGFRVYRSRTGSPEDAVLIAQFDQRDEISGGIRCFAAEELFAGGEFAGAVCTDIRDAPFGENTGLNFAIIDRGGEFPDPASGSGLINGIPVAYSVTAFAVNPGQTPVSLSPQGLAALVPPPAPLVLESGLLPFKRATPRSEASSLADARVGQGEILDGAGNVISARQDLPVDADGNLTGPIPPAQDGSVSVQVIQALAIPADFAARVVIDSTPVAPGWAHPNFCGSDDTAASCIFGIADVFDEVPAGDARARQVWFHVEDGQGNRLLGPAGEAIGVVNTDFISFSGVTSFTSAPVEVLSPIDPDMGVAFTVALSSSIGQRSGQCSLNGTCVLSTPDGAGVPASVADFGFSRGLYGQYRYADIEVTWSNQGGVLSLSSVRDISNSVDLDFRSGWGTEQWGFAKATGLAAPEAAEAAGIPTTADGKVLFPEPFCGGLPGNCVNYGSWTGMTQSGPAWTDLPFDPDIFEKLAPFRMQFAAVPFHQPGALSENAALVNVDGKQGTRLYISGHWLDLVFNNLPADGEQWLVRLPNVAADAPRPVVPGMAIRVPIMGGTNEIANADLSQIKVVPNPFIVTNAASAGQGRQKLLFTHLPPQATIRIYTISGNLVRVLNHMDGSGTEEWDVRSRYDLLLASGNYYYHVTTQDGRTHLGRFAVVN